MILTKENKQQIQLLNTLLVANNTRIEGYRNASQNTDESELKTLFFRFMQTSQRCKTELIHEVLILESVANEALLEHGNMATLWTEIGLALDIENKHQLISKCLHAEELMLHLYRRGLKENSEFITAEQQTILRDQFYCLKNDCDKIKKIVERSVSRLN